MLVRMVGLMRMERAIRRRVGMQLDLLLCLGIVTVTVTEIWVQIWVEIRMGRRNRMDTVAIYA